MPAYRCELVDGAGHRKVLIREAVSKDEIARIYSTGNEYLLSIDLADGKKRRHRRRFPPDVILEFTEMIGILLESGLPLKEALGIAADISHDGRIKELFEGVLDAVKKGDSLATAIDGYGDSFSPLYRGMVRVGQRIGSVERVFPRLAGYLSERKAFREKTASALAYPLLVLVVAISGTIGIVAFVLPKLLEIFSQIGGIQAEKIGENARAMLLTFDIAGAVAGAAAVCAFFAWLIRKRGARGSEVIDRWILRIPWAGSFIIASETLNFAFAMETLVSGGVTVELALGEVEQVVENRAFRSAISRSKDDVLRGEPLSVAIGKYPLIPSYVSRWIAVGERSGQVERVFGQIRRFCQSEVEKKTSRFMALAEPAMILLVGLVVLGLVLFFIVPLFSMYGAML